jgi:hypothetical protein
MKIPNDEFLRLCRNTVAHFPGETVIVYLEKIVSYNAKIGKTTLETVELCGRIKEIFETRGIKVVDVPRREVKKFWLKKGEKKKYKTADANIREEILKRFGGKEKAIGRKKSPGILYGFHADEWQALAIALMYVDDMGDWIR